MFARSIPYWPLGLLAYLAVWAVLLGGEDGHTQACYIAPSRMGCPTALLSATKYRILYRCEVTGAACAPYDPAWCDPDAAAIYRWAYHLNPHWSIRQWNANFETSG